MQKREAGKFKRYYCNLYSIINIAALFIFDNFLFKCFYYYSWVFNFVFIKKVFSIIKSKQFMQIANMNSILLFLGHSFHFIFVTCFEYAIQSKSRLEDFEYIKMKYVQ